MEGSNVYSAVLPFGAILRHSENRDAFTRQTACEAPTCFRTSRLVARLGGIGYNDGAATPGRSDDEVMTRIRRMKADVIRQVSAIFDSRSLGYKSTLVAMKFPPDDIDRGAAIINRHPGVSHNYRRSHVFNLWFTLTIHNNQDIAEEVDKLGVAAGSLHTILLPTIHLYKIGVKMDMTSEKDVTRQEEGQDVS